MKHILNILLCALVMGSCADYGIEKDKIRITGNIENPADDSIRIVDGDFSRAFALDSAGHFEAVFDAPEGYYTFRHGNERSSIYLSPGYDLELKLNSEEFDESLSFSGTGEAENNYLAEKYLVQEDNSLDVKSYYLMDEEEFSERNAADKSRIDSLLSSYDVSESFRSLESRNIQYEYLKDAKRYDAYHAYFTGNKDFKSSDSFRARFDSMDYSLESDFAAIPAYRDLVRDFILADGVGEALDKLDSIESELIVGDMLDILMQYLSPGMEDLDAHVERMRKMTDDEDFLTALDQKHQKMEALKKGKASPGFEYEDIGGNMVALEDLRGKNVYIDVWATWCGPCKAEIPHLKALEEEFHGENVSFVSISVDEPEAKAKWEKMVRDKELKGVQLITDNGWDTDFIESYLINGIPRFILLDTEGNIVSADAPRPSSDAEIKSMLRDLL